MPHYSDGTEAKVGDIARGTPSNTKRVVEGAVVRIHESTACNLVIAFPRVQPANNLAVGMAIEGTDKVAALAYDYGDICNFELVHRDE